MRGRLTNTVLISKIGPVVSEIAGGRPPHYGGQGPPVALWAMGCGLIGDIANCAMVLSCRHSYEHLKPTCHISERLH